MKELIETIYNYSYGNYIDKKLEVKKILESTTIDKMDLYSIFLKYTEDGKTIFDDLQVDLTIPSSDNGLVTTDEKSRVQITSARYHPLLKLYGGNSIKVGSLYIELNKNAVQLNYEDFSTCEEFFNYFGLAREYNPDADLNTIRTLNQEEVTELADFNIPDSVTYKLELISSGKYKFGNKITKEFIEALLKISQDKDLVNEYSASVPTDYIYMTALDGLAYEIRSNLKMIRNDLRFNLDKNQLVYTTTVQNIIDRYFKLQANNFRDVQVSKDSNAVSMLSQTKRLYFYDGNDTNGWTKIREYNKYFEGVLDPVKTVDGPNTSISNELTLATKIESGKIYIELLDMNFKPVKVLYNDYSRSAVLSSDNVEWSTKKIILVDGKYSYQKYGSYYDTTNIKDINYIRPLDNLLSPATACIPFLNRMVGTRSALSSHFTDQSIPVVGAKPSVVSTPAVKKYYEESPYNTKSEVDGTVVEIMDSLIKVKDDATGKEFIYGDKKSYSGTADHTTNLFEPTVKVGDKVKKNQVVVKMNSFVDGEFTTQVPLYVWYGTYEGHEHEDGIILTESAAKKFDHIEVMQVERYLDEDADYVFTERPETNRFDKYGLIKVGQKVERGDPIFDYKKVSYNESKYNKLKEALIGDGSVTESIVTKVPYDIEHGTIMSVHIYSNDMYNENNKDFIKYYDSREFKDNEAYKNFTGLDKEKVELYEGTKYYIVVEVKYVSTMEPGRLSGKISNFYASKGVNAYIIPQNEAPTDEWGNTIECIIQPTTTYSRQNPGQIDDTKLGLIGLMGYKWLKDNYTDKSMESKVTEFLTTLYPNGYDIKDLIATGDKYGYLRIEVSPFDKYYTNKVILSLLDMLNLGNGDCKIYLPKYHKWTQLTNTVGITSMMRLHFMQEVKAKATSEISVESDDDVLGYKLMNKDDGQKTGGQEAWALMGHGKTDVLMDITSTDATKQSRFAAALLMLGMKYED